MSGLLNPLRLALAQVNSLVGDLEGNAARISRNIEAARDGGAELVLLPELAITGYSPEDLLLKEHFLLDAREALDSVAAGVEGIVAVVGFPERREDVFNSIAVLRRRRASRRSTARRGCGTTASPTRSATSRPATAARCSISGTRGSG